MTHASEPAWPSVEQREAQPGHYTPIQHPGLTKREAFAMAAMQGALANNDTKTVYRLVKDCACEGFAEECVAIADALLAQLSKDTPA